MLSRLFWSLLVLGSLLTIGFLLFSDLPLGIPGEWTWNRIPSESVESPQSIGDMIVFSLSAMIWLVVVFWAARRVSGLTHPLILLLLLTFCSLFLVRGLQKLPGPTDLPKSWVLYFPSMSGYFHLARYEMEDTRQFLKTYQSRMAEGDVLHIGTHPPGLFLLYRGLWNVLKQSPAFTETILTLMSESSRQELEVLEDIASKSGRRLSAADRATLWTFRWFTEFIAVLTIIPLYLLLRRSVSAPSAWFACCCWPLIPALSIFLPKSDALFPCLGFLFLWLWVTAVEFASVWRAVSAGIVFWCGSMLSLAVVPIGLMAGSYSLYGFWKNSPSIEEETSSRMSHARTILCSIASFFALSLWIGFSYQCNLFAVWLWNYHNHAAFYEQFNRTYLTWLVLNPVEMIFAIGAPLIAAAACGFIESIRQRGQSQAILWAATLIWGGIWLSGKNSGEAARLWLVFYPIAIMYAANYLESLSASEQKFRRTATVLVTSQLLVSSLTVISVTGFSV